jgi:Fe2+ or Zn2+ uptake regulation protein
MHMNIAEPRTRQTKYCVQIEEIIKRLGHASNAQILIELNKIYPGVSTTTVHRATARLAARGELGVGPVDLGGAMRYDANVTPHDHFLCVRCGLLRDADIARHVAPLLEDTIEGCRVSGRITISGTCKACNTKGRFYA